MSIIIDPPKSIVQDPAIFTQLLKDVDGESEEVGASTVSPPSPQYNEYSVGALSTIVVESLTLTLNEDGQLAGFGFIVTFSTEGSEITLHIDGVEVDKQSTGYTVTGGYIYYACLRGLKSVEKGSRTIELKLKNTSGVSTSTVRVVNAGVAGINIYGG